MLQSKINKYFQVHYGRLKCLNAFPKPMADILAEMLDLHVLKNRSMILLYVANLFGMMGFYVPIIFSADRTVNLGVKPEDAALLLSIMGMYQHLTFILTSLFFCIY